MVKSTLFEVILDSYCVFSVSYLKNLGIAHYNVFNHFMLIVKVGTLTNSVDSIVWQAPPT